MTRIICSQSSKNGDYWGGHGWSPLMGLFWARRYHWVNSSSCIRQAHASIFIIGIETQSDPS